MDILLSAGVDGVFNELFDIPTGAPILLCVEGDIYAPPVNKDSIGDFFQRIALGQRVFQVAHGLWITGKDGRLIRIHDFKEHDRGTISFPTSYLEKGAQGIVGLPKGKYLRQVLNLRPLRNEGIQNLLNSLTALELPKARRQLLLLSA